MADELDRDKVRDMRKAMGLTLLKASEGSGMKGGASAWHDIESGRKSNVTLETLYGIAAALKCDPRDLLAWPTAKKLPPKKKGRAAK